jgi:hypothetical protein
MEPDDSSLQQKHKNETHLRQFNIAHIFTTCLFNIYESKSKRKGIFF